MKYGCSLKEYRNCSSAALSGRLSCVMCDVNCRLTNSDGSPGLRVAAHDRMLGALLGMTEDGGGVHRGQTQQQLLDGLGQRGVHQALIRPHGVAAGGRDLAHVEDGELRR